MRLTLALALTVAWASACKPGISVGSPGTPTNGEAPTGSRTPLNSCTRGERLTSASPVAANRWIDATSSGLKSQTRLVISDRETLARVWRDAWPTKVVPSVDFTQHSLVLFAAGERMTGGFSAVIDSVCSSAGAASIFARVVSPPAGAMVTEMITSPADLVRVPLLSGRVSWNVSQ